MDTDRATMDDTQLEPRRTGRTGHGNEDTTAVFTRQYHEVILPILQAIVRSGPFNRFLQLRDTAGTGEGYIWAHFERLAFCVPNNIAGVGGMKLAESLQWLESKQTQLSRQLQFAGQAMTKAFAES